MQKLIAVAAIAGLLAAGGRAEDPKTQGEAKKEAPKKPEVTLKVGDPAPALNADQWLQGNEVKAFEAGKVYVVEFWATWCGPCISAMPHLAHLQGEFKGKGVTVIGYTSKDPNNPADKVAAFVKHRGPKLGYTFAYSDGTGTNDAWMKAGGRAGIPCSFVVGRDGKLAYIGHPIYLDSVLPKVVDGTWKVEEGMAEVARITKDLMALNRAVASKDAEANLRAIDAFETANPGMAHAGYFAGQRLDALLQLKRTDEAKKVAERTVGEAAKWGDVTRLRAVSVALRTGAGGDKGLLDVAVKAAEGMLDAAGDKDPAALLNLASTHLAAGDAKKAEEYADRAVAVTASESPKFKELVEKEAKKIKGEDK